MTEEAINVTEMENLDVFEIFQATKLRSLNLRHTINTENQLLLHIHSQIS